MQSRIWTFILSLIMAAIVAPWASAVTLPIVPEPHDDPLPINKDEPTIPCDQILSRFLDYNQMALQHDQAVLGFLGQVSDKARAWYAVLKPLEGTDQKLAPGTFAPIQDGADKIDQITDLAYNNVDLLRSRRELIATSLRKCLPASASKP